MPKPRKLHDQYFRQAKRDGYLARSAYKLIEIDDRRKLIKPGARVLDLGCAPGSWLQVVSERLGPEGVLVGVDLKPVLPGVPARAYTMVGDFLDATVDDLIAPAGGHSYDLVLSDMAPNTAGGGQTDHFRSIRLCETIVERLPGVLRPGGACVMKVFEGEAFKGLLDACRAVFRDAKPFKPRACRDLSSETYVVCLGYRPPRAPEGDASADVERA